MRGVRDKTKVNHCIGDMNTQTHTTISSLIYSIPALICPSYFIILHYILHIYIMFAAISVMTQNLETF